MSLLRVDGLVVEYRQGLLGGRLRAVDGASLELDEGEALGIVGGNGCGKTSLARAIMRLLEPQEGTVEFMGRDITGLRGRELRWMGPEMQMVFQDPQGAMNPRMRLRDSMLEPLRLHRPDSDMEDELRSMVNTVGLNRELLDRYPHQLSGGQLQRAFMARCLSLRPSLLIMDESTSMLDALVQAQVMELVRKVRTNTGLAVMMISHDVELVRQTCDRINRMDAGRLSGDR